jgi:hypothetical protein
VNGQLAPKSNVVEVAEPIAQRGRQNFKTRHGEHLEVLPGFVPPACCPKVPCEQGRAVGLKRELVGPAKPKWRERSEGQAAVRLADSTPRSGEPATWGSGQRALNCSKATGRRFISLHSVIFIYNKAHTSCLARSALRHQTPKVGAGCSNWARPDPCELRLESARNCISRRSPWRVVKFCLPPSGIRSATSTTIESERTISPEIVGLAVGNDRIGGMKVGSARQA